MSRIDGDLRKLFRKHIGRAFWKSIETGATQGGIPDSHVTLDHTSVFVEFKMTKAWAVTLRPLQVGFALTETRHGGRVIIAIRREHAGTKKATPCDDLYLVDGAAAARLSESGLQGLVQGDELYHGTGSVSGWDWDAVRSVLAGGSGRPAAGRPSLY